MVNRQKVFLPVAERELRIAARQNRTYVLRRWSAMAALAIAGSITWMESFSGRRMSGGRDLFEALTWMAYVLCLISGVTLTLDVLSKEKREGTLGLLFLTDLRSYDIVFGKMASSGLKAFCILAAIVPVIALAMLMGGTSLPELGRVTLALSLTLLFSMSVGMLISVLTRGSAGLMLFITLGIFVYGFGLTELSKMVGTLAFSGQAEVMEFLNLVNTGYLLRMGFETARWIPGNHFWVSAGVIALMSVLLITATVKLLPRCWQVQKDGKRTSLWRNRWRSFLYGRERTRRQLRARFLEVNPIGWMATRYRIPSFGLLLLMLAIGLVSVGVGTVAGTVAPVALAWAIGTVALHLLLLVGIAVFAGWRLLEDRQSGALELVAVTPLSNREILYGFWQSLQRRMVSPIFITLFFTAMLVSWFVQTVRSVEALPEFLPWLAEGVFQLITGQSGHPFHSTAMIYFVIACVALPTAWIALGAVALWASMHFQGHVSAALLTLAIVLLPPSIVCFTVYGFLEFLRASQIIEMSLHFPFAPRLWTAVTLVYHGLLIFGTRHHLLRQFRILASTRYIQKARKKIGFVEI